MIAIIPHSFMVVRFSVIYVSSVPPGSSLFRRPLRGQCMQVLWFLDQSLLFKMPLVLLSASICKPTQLPILVEEESEANALFSLLIRVFAMCHSVLYKPCSLPPPGSLLCATVYCTSSYQHGCSMGCCLMSRESSS